MNKHVYENTIVSLLRTPSRIIRRIVREYNLDQNVIIILSITSMDVIDLSTTSLVNVSFFLILVLAFLILLSRVENVLYFNDVFILEF